jgi:NAD(P)-dependent dehydrogenase (short-subunit alcohol dehydrogenase family)
VSQDEIGTVVVTGAASGLGRAIAQAIEEDGGKPVGLDLAPADGFESEQVDLADGAAAEAAVERIAERHGGLNGVVTAAGTDACGPLGTLDAAAWNRVIAVNLIGTAAVVRAALPALERSRGHVVTIASTLGVRALPDATAYCASKFGVVGFSRALAAEAEGRVNVTLLLPGGMRTAFFDGREQKYKPPPEADLAPPEQVAAAVVFALTRPPGAQLREALVCTPGETSWP